jgi:hypothetical protein
MDSTGAQHSIVRVAISTSSSGAATIVAATASESIYVLAWWISNGATANGVNLQSHTTTTNTSGVTNMAVNGGAVFPFNPMCWIVTTSGEALDINLTGATQVNGWVAYVKF